jgi:hypothetical protein
MASILVTYDDYVRITGDDQADQAEVEANIDEVLGMVEEELDRIFLFGTYTESLPLTSTGWVYPRAVPVASVPASASTQVWDDGWSLRGASADVNVGPFPDLTEIVSWREGGLRATVTYTGGLTHDTFPKKLRRLVCRLTLATANPGTGIPAGAQSASVGDVSVSFEAGTIMPGELDALLPGTYRALDGFRRPVY